MNDEVRALIDYRLQRKKARGALNRVYYAMFYAVPALLASRQLSASKHSGAIALFHRKFVKINYPWPFDMAKQLQL